MATEDLALPRGSTVLVTGGSGLVGSHIVDKLLDRGYAIRVTTRSVKNAEWMRSFFQDRHPHAQLDLVEVADLGDSSSLDKALSGVHGVVHTASNMSMTPDPNEAIPSTVNHIQAILKAAARTGSVRRFVYTSSSTAITCPSPGVQYHIDDTKWNDADVERAWAPPPYDPSRGYIVYSASKTEAERAAWEFMRTAKPGFTLSTVLPDTCFGRILSESAGSVTAKAVSIAFTAADEGHKTLENTPVLQIPPQWMVDVEDVAKLHVIGLIDTDVNGKRLLGLAHQYNWTKIINAFKKAFPERRFVSPPENEAEDIMTVDTGNATDLLQKWYGQNGWTPFEETIRKNVESIQ